MPGPSELLPRTFPSKSSVAIETTAKVKTGRQDERAYGVRFKGLTLKSLDYSAEWIGERGNDGPNSINAWGASIGAGYRVDRFWAQTLQRS